MKILTVVGARPNFMKAASIIAAIQQHNEAVGRTGTGAAIQHVLVHTGQHYDPVMSGAFFTDLDMPAPDILLGVGSGSHVVQTAEILKKFETVLLDQKPDSVVVVGDVNSTVACALVTAKISFDAVGTRPLLVHVESGLRSFDPLMPEEVNRVVTDHISDLLLVTEESGVHNLRKEGIRPASIHFVGNTMIDSLLQFQEKAGRSSILNRLKLRGAASKDDGNSVLRYALLTLHRPSNVDNAAAFREVLGGLEELATQCPIVFPVHPRTKKQMRQFGLESGLPGMVLTEALGYLDFVCLMKNAALVVTDSGGVQEETTCLGIPCVTVRDNTERPATVEYGTNVIAGTSKEKITAAIRRQMARKTGQRVPEKWDGQAGARIIEVLVRAIAERQASQEALCAAM